MANPFDPFSKLHDIHRLHDSLGIGRITGIADRLGLGSLHEATTSRYMSSSLADILGKLQSTLGSGEFERVRSVTSALSRYSVDSAALSSHSMYRVSELWKSIAGPSMRVSRQLEALFDRSKMPWLEAHKAIWPCDAGVLRMLDKNEFGVASWLSDEALPKIEAVDTRPRFDFGALVAGSARDARESTPLNIKANIRCYLCKGAIFAEESSVDWLGPKELDLTIDVVPFCSECSQRESDEPGFMSARLREMAGEAGEAAESERIQLSISSGDETDPVPRGELRVVRDDDRDDEE